MNPTELLLYLMSNSVSSVSIVSHVSYVSIFQGKNQMKIKAVPILRRSKVRTALCYIYFCRSSPK